MEASIGEAALYGSSAMLVEYPYVFRAKAVKDQQKPLGLAPL